VERISYLLASVQRCLFPYLREEVGELTDSERINFQPGVRFQRRCGRWRHPALGDNHFGVGARQSGCDTAYEDDI